MPLVLPRRSLSLDFVRDGQASGDNYADELSKLDPLLTFGRASTATRFNAAGSLETVASGQPRFDFDPATLKCRGLLIEEARTNLLLYSQDFTNAAWTKASSAVTAASTTAPTGTALGTKVQVSAGSNTYNLYGTGFSTTNATKYTISFYAKYGNARWLWVRADVPTSVWAAFDLQNGVVGNTIGAVDQSTMASIGGGWYRCTLTWTATFTAGSASLVFTIGSGSTPTNAAVTQAGTEYFYLFGAQVEAGAFATSYIATTSAAVTRAAEGCYTNQLSPWYSQPAFTIFGEYIAAPVVANYQTAFSLALSNSERIECYNHVLDVVAGNVSQGGVTTNFTAGAVNKTAVAMGAGRVTGIHNAGTLAAATGKTPPAAAVYLNLGVSLSGTSLHLNGALRRFTYLPYAVSDSLLKALTS